MKTATDETMTRTDELLSKLRSVLETYKEHNSSNINDTSTEPSPLEFMRAVAQNRPMVMRRAAADWKAVRKWDRRYLEETLQNGPVKVAVTPNGRADDLYLDPSTKELVYTIPLETEEPFNTALADIIDANGQMKRQRIKYCQTQNDNLRDEYDLLMNDVPKSIPFARVALRLEPDAINFWLGNQHSVTAMHKDNYENIYVQVRGRKRFTMFPPIMAPFVRERTVKVAAWASSDGQWKPQLLDPVQEIPVPTRPINSSDTESGVSALAEFFDPTIIELDEGDMMYLPAMWYHQVEQECGPEGFCCSVNYW